MKTLHKINFWALAANIVLFIVPYFGMLFMTVLGAIQLILALVIVLCYYSRLDHKMRVMVVRYWIFVAIDFIGMAIAYHYDNFANDVLAVPTLFLFPAAIAIYFLYTTYTITKNLSHEYPAPQH